MPSVPAGAISPFEAARQAFDHTRRQLFPIRVERWLALGLVAFLEQCGRAFRGGGGVGGRGDHHLGVPAGGRPFDLGGIADWLGRASEWLGAHAVVVALGSLAGLLLIAVVMAVVLWLNARGVFVYVDDVATGRADVTRPWRQHASAASSYFGWSLGISLAGVFVLLLATGVVVVGVWSFLTGRVQGTEAWLAVAAIAPILGLLLLALLLLSLAGLALRDFVAPLQLATGLPCGASARILESLVLAQPGAFVLYLLLKLLAVVVSGLVVAIGGCLTCCIGFLPVVMQTVFQPLFYFERALSIFLLRQMGHDVSVRLAG